MDKKDINPIEVNALEMSLPELKERQAQIDRLLDAPGEVYFLINHPMTEELKERALAMLPKEDIILCMELAISHEKDSEGPFRFDEEEIAIIKENLKLMKDE